MHTLLHYAQPLPVNQLTRIQMTTLRSTLRNAHKCPLPKRLSDSMSILLSHFTLLVIPYSLFVFILSLMGLACFQALFLSGRSLYNRFVVVVYPPFALI